MKGINGYFIFILPILLFSCDRPKEENNQTKKPAVAIDSLMVVIDKETSSFYAGNYEAWKACWAHDDLSSQTWNNDDGSFSSAQGWEAIDKQGKDWIDKYYEGGKKVIHPEYFRKDIKLKILSDTAVYLTWVQYNAYSDKEIYGVSRELRLLLWKEGQWKIFQVAAFWDSKNRLKKDSVEVILNQK